MPDRPARSSTPSSGGSPRRVTSLSLLSSTFAALARTEPDPTQSTYDQQVSDSLKQADLDRSARRKA